MAKADGMKGWQHYDGDYPHYRRRKGTHEYLIHPIRYGDMAGKHGLESYYTGSAGPGGNTKTYHGAFDTAEDAAAHAETLRGGKPKKVRKLEDAIMGGKRTLGTALGIEKKKDASSIIAESGPVTLRHNASLNQHEVHHAEHGLVATIHDVGAGRHPKGTHVISPRGSLADEMGDNETRPSLISAFEHVAGHARNLPSQSEIGERLKNSEAGTDHHYGIAAKHVMGQAFEAKNGQYRYHPPNHVIEHKGFVHEYYDDGGSHVGVHINTKSGTQHVSFHPGVTSAIDAHAQAMSGRGGGRPQRATLGSPHPGRAYRDSSGIATHEYYPAKDRAGFYGTHLSYFPNTSVAEVPRGDATAYGNSSSPNHDFHVSYHPTAKSHDEAHMQYLKARGVVKSADGGDDMRGADEIDPPALVKAAANGHTIPSIGKWNMYAGGTAAAPGKHAYDHYAPGGLLGSSLQQDARGEGIPGSHRTDGNMQYTIHPVSNESGRHVGYHLGVAGHPLSPGLHESLGMFNHPAKAAKAAREHYESKMPH